MACCIYSLEVECLKPTHSMCNDIIGSTGEAYHKRTEMLYSNYKRASSERKFLYRGAEVRLNYKNLSLYMTLLYL